MDYILISILIMSLVTIALRFAPFFLFANKKTPEVVLYLGKVLPPAIMGMLCIYCLKDTKIFEMSSIIPTCIASMFVVVSYAIKRNTLLSIFLGTVLYMVILQGLF